MSQHARLSQAFTHIAHEQLQICQGMEHLIQEGIFHCNLAARNVLLFFFDQNDALSTSVKVADFGFFARANMHTSSHVYGGRCKDRHVRHMSPEVLKKARYMCAYLCVRCAVNEALKKGRYVYMYYTSKHVLAHIRTQANTQVP